MIEALIVVVMTVTCYCPRAGGINGSMDGGAAGIKPYHGMAACGPRYKFGTRFTLTGAAAQRAADVGLPATLICLDRGGMIGNRNLDVAIVGEGGTARSDYKLCKRFGGKFRAEVIIEKSKGETGGRSDSQQHTRDRTDIRARDFRHIVRLPDAISRHTGGHVGGR
jgi:hypothetical protein